MKNFKSLQRALATGNFRPELVTLPGGMEPPERPLPLPAAPRRLTETPHTAGNTPTPQSKGRIGNQVQENNPNPAQLMQIGPGFRIRMAIDSAAADRVDILHTDDGCHFCLLYHLKGVCNTHCGGCHLNRPLSQSKLGSPGEWRRRYCGGNEEPLVRDVATGSRSQASTLSAGQEDTVDTKVGEVLET